MGKKFGLTSSLCSPSFTVVQRVITMISLVVTAPNTVLFIQTSAVSA